MKFISLPVLGFVAALCAMPAFAKDKHDRGDQGNPHAAEQRGGDHRFGDNDHARVRAYYADEARGGHCPPGLAKKHNGCLPPGQARKWAVGRPLPPDVTYYALPPALVVQLTPPPAGYRYVRVAGDVLMIAAGTGIVVDAILDLGGR